MSTPGDDLRPVLDRISGADLYRNNAFRVTGLASDATPAQIRRAREEAVLASRLAAPTRGPVHDPARAPDPDPARDPSGATPATAPPATESVRAAYETMRDPVARLVHELLWLWRSDEPGRPLSVEHDLAVRTHREAVETEEAGPYPPGSEAVRALDELWARGLAAWASVLASREFWDHAKRRITDIGDPRLTTGTVRRLRDRLPRHLASVSAEFALRAVRTGSEGAGHRLVTLLRDSPLPDDAVADALRDVVRPAERAVRTACDAAREKARADEDGAGAAGNELLEKADEPMRTVRALLGAEATLTGALSEELAVVLNQCAVTHYNADHPPGLSLELLLRAAEFARDPRTRELVATNKKGVEASVGAAVPTGPSPDLFPYLQAMCRRGRVERAAGHLRALASAVGPRDRTMSRQLRDLATDRRSVAAPVRGEPFIGSVAGFGVRPRRSAGPDAHGVLCATYMLTLLYVPVFPIAAYLMNGDGIHAKVPVSAAARWWRRLLLVLAPWLVLLPFIGAPTAMGFVMLSLLALNVTLVSLRKHRVSTLRRYQAAR
ncbi:hypothetical protein [Streptomyces sp. NBC_00370]|uniref:hypothetical protein n=1 Tax=Streptomyces sp. NBC_00370 TaxID=2975728 RepID=UPI002E267B15